MTRKEAIAKIREKKQWDQKEVTIIINELTPNNRVLMPKELEIGDFFMNQAIKHPSLILEARGKYFLTCGLTSTKSELVVAKLRHRYDRDNYVYPSLQISDPTDKSNLYMGSVTKDEVQRVKALVFDAMRRPDQRKTQMHAA